MSDASLEWKLYICRACGLIYDEKEGDPDSGLVAGTRFEDIPEDWECPLCGVTKSDFELFERPVIDAQAATFSAKNKNTPGIVIMGGGIAGWSMAAAIRQHDTNIPVTMITACAGDVYHKPELSVAIGRSLNEKALVREKGHEAAQRLAINLLANTYVVGLSAKSKIVRTTRGSIDFTQLVLAQGAESKPLKNIPAEWCWRINHLNNWSGLEQKLKHKKQRIAIIGGGMIGCELAENLSLAGHKVSLIYRNDTPLNQLLPKIAGQRFEQYLLEQGIECIPSSSVDDVIREADQEHTAFTLRLSNQSSLTVDHIVTATGLAADKRLPKMAGLDYQNGIVVNEQTLETSQKHIYALGDCISIAGQPCHFIAPISQQAKVICAQVLGLDQNTYHHEKPIIRLKVQACSLVLNGQPSANAEWQTIADDEQHLRMQQWHEGVLVSTLELAKAS